jgi:PAS domain S-box-containing protein
MGSIDPMAGPGFVRHDFSVLAEALPQLVWISDAAGHVFYLNRPWIDYTGVDVDELTDDARSTIVHPDDLDRTSRAWETALETQAPYEIEHRLRRAHDDSYRWFLARAVPTFDETGRLRSWVGTATDIDEQKRANDNLHFLLEASAQFSPPLDEREITQRFADLAVERNADWTIVFLRDDANRLEASAIAHRDPAKRYDMEKYRTEPLPGLAADVARAVHENGPILHAAVNPQLVASEGGPPMNSAMVVPLSTDDGRVFGAAVLASAWWRYDDEDLEIAATVARRAATALQNARVIESERRTSDLLRFCARAGELLFEGFDFNASLERVCEFAVRDIADFAMVVRRGDDGALRVACATGKTIELDYHASTFISERAARPELETALHARLRSGKPYLVKSYDVERIAPLLWEYVIPHVRALNVDSYVTIPILSRGQVFGAISFATCGISSPFVDSDLTALGELGRTASIAVGQAESFARERRIATELQRALLPRGETLPRVEGLQFNAMYRPSSDDADIGGDWYDALTLPDGSIVLSVGDVTGRGLVAAGFMGKLRQAVGVAALYEADPARMLDAIDLLLRQRGSQGLATAFVGIIDPQRKTLRYANAGHPYPMLKRDDEIVELRAFGLPLGLRDRGVSGESQTVRLDRAQMLVLYTDGLVESTHDMIEGERRLLDVLRSDAVRFVRNPSEFICNACVGAYAPDDTAVLTLLFGDQRRWAFDAENAQAAHDARGEFIEYLRTHRAAGDLMAAEIIFGELIGNVVRHAPGPIDIQLEWGGEHPVLHVTDRGTGFNRTPALPDDMLKESGRGLFIIETLSRELNVEYVPGYGTHAAVTLPLARD